VSAQEEVRNQEGIEGKRNNERRQGNPREGDAATETMGREGRSSESSTEQARGAQIFGSKGERSRSVQNSQRGGNGQKQQVLAEAVESRGCAVEDMK
jgi:hypothetical protein